jgi:hypothetical protein
VGNGGKGVGRRRNGLTSPKKASRLFKRIEHDLNCLDQGGVVLWKMDENKVRNGG